MTTLQFLDRLRNLDISIWLEGETLRFRAPARALDDGMKEELARRKPELIRLLRQVPAESVDEPLLARADRAAPIPLSFAQQRLWFLDQLQPGVPAYNMFDALEVAHGIDVAAFQRAVNELVRRHEILRTTFPAVDGVPTQLVAPASEVALPVVDLTSLPEEVRVAEARRRALEESETPFDLARGPLLRVALLKLGPARDVVLLSVHHIVSDDGSMKLLYRELELLYTAHSIGRSSPLPELPIQWADFAAWQHRRMRGGVLESHVKYWAGQLAGELPTLNLPLDHPRRQPARGRNGQFFFGSELASDLRNLCTSEGVTLFMVALAGYAALLARYSRQDDFIIGSPISDRSRVETEGMIGFFLNTLPLRVRVDPHASFRDLLRQVREVCLAGYAYQDVPYEALLQNLSCGRDLGGNPLFQTMLVMHEPVASPGSCSLWTAFTDGEDEDAAGSGDGAYVSKAGNGTTKFDLSITLAEQAHGVRGNLEYNSDIFDEATIAGLIGQYQILLGRAAADPGRRVCDLPLMTYTQRRELLQAWSRGASRPLEVSCLHEHFERHARLQPFAIAVEEGGNFSSYGDLNAQANQLAHALRARGIGPESRVGILFERSRQMLVALLAALKAGAACVPLDPDHPKERIDLIVDDAGIDVLLTMEAIAKRTGSNPVRTLYIDRDRAEIAAYGALDPPCATHSENLACILYTSGTTGRPKGVLLTHRALVNFTEAATRDCRIDSADRVLQFHSIAFDSGVEECFIALSAGATLVLRTPRMLDSTAGFVEHCRLMRLTTLVLPTAYWHELVAGLGTSALPSSLRLVVIGGERALPDKLARWQACVADRIDLINAYGPTETAIAVTRHRFSVQDGEAPASREVSIGRPVANSSVYVLDQWMQPVPCGALGEVYLGGGGLARGYLDAPGLTAERFVADPFTDTAGARMYRTGDLARFLPDGTLEYRGRVDTQVKIRGHRVEPREVEAVLQEHETVEDVVVLAREDEPGDKRLVAYIVPRDGRRIGSSELGAFLKRKLPSYMLPATFVLLPVLPLNANGKVNHRALPAPDAGRAELLVSEERERVRTPTEETLEAIFSAVLKLNRIGLNEDFFELGGHSLLATQVVARVNDTMRIDLPLRQLFERSTIAELAPVVDGLIQTGGDERTRFASMPASISRHRRAPSARNTLAPAASGNRGSLL